MSAELLSYLVITKVHSVSTLYNPENTKLNPLHFVFISKYCNGLLLCLSLSQYLSRKEDRECKNILCPLPVGRYYILLKLRLSFRVQPVLLAFFMMLLPLCLMRCRRRAPRRARQTASREAHGGRRVPFSPCPYTVR